MNYLLTKDTSGISSVSLLPILNIIEKYNDYLLFCVDKCLGGKYSKKYSPDIFGIQLIGLEYQRIDIPNITNDFDFLDTYFFKEMLICFKNKNKHINFLFEKYVLIGFKLIASHFFSDYPSSFNVKNIQPLVNSFNKLYLSAFEVENITPQLALQRVNVDYKLIQNPDNFNKFLNVDVRDVDAYNSAKWSIALYANRISRILESNLIKVLNEFYKEKEETAKEVKGEIEYLYSSTFIVSKIADIIIKAFDRFFEDTTELMDDKRKLDIFTNSEHIIHLSDLNLGK